MSGTATPAFDKEGRSTREGASSLVVNNCNNILLISKSKFRSWIFKLSSNLIQGLFLSITCNILTQVHIFSVWINRTPQLLHSFPFSKSTSRSKNPYVEVEVMGGSFHRHPAQHLVRLE